MKKLITILLVLAAINSSGQSIGIGYTTNTLGPTISFDYKQLGLYYYVDGYDSNYKLQCLLKPAIKPITKHLVPIAGVGMGIGFWKPNYVKESPWGGELITVRNSWRKNPIISATGIVGIKYGTGAVGADLYYMPSVDIAGNNAFNMGMFGLILKLKF